VIEKTLEQAAGNAVTIGPTVLAPQGMLV
jgi:hypothetical protein